MSRLMFNERSIDLPVISREHFWSARALPFLLMLFVHTGFACPSQAQQFQLVEPTGVITADVYFSGGQMIVNDANGTRYVFQRDRYFDSFNRQYVGYIHPALNRVVRWPRSGRGLMQVTDLDDAFPRYVFSRRSVRAVRGNGNLPGRRGGVPGYRRRIPGHPGYLPPASAYIPYAFNSPYGYNPYAIPLQYGYQSFGPSLNIVPGGLSLPLGGGGRLRPPVSRVQSVVLESKVVPRAPLAPARLQLQNTGRREIIVTIQDRISPSAPKQVRIAAGASVVEAFQRDAGADRIKTVRRYLPDGSAVTQDITIPVDPAPRYELVVHERRVQSVSIDRTGKSPQMIEDVQFQGRGLGRFELPPGDQLESGAMDVIRVALGAGNQGSVTPIREDDDANRSQRTRSQRTRSQRTRRPSSLEEMLLQQQRAGR